MIFYMGIPSSKETGDYTVGLPSTGVVGQYYLQIEQELLMEHPACAPKASLDEVEELIESSKDILSYVEVKSIAKCEIDLSHPVLKARMLDILFVGIYGGGHFPNGIQVKVLKLYTLS